MAFGFKNLFAALAALVFSAGHVACACLPGSSGIPDSQIAEAAAHSHEAVGTFRHHDHGSAPSENSGGPFGDPCGRCQIARYAAAPDAAKLQASSLAAAPLIAFLPGVISPEAPSLDFKSATRVHWAAAPSLTLVALKIRLVI